MSYLPAYHRIISITTNKRILHVEDCLHMDKIRLDLYEYERGKGATAHAEHYLDLHTARRIAWELAHDQTTTHEEFKGTHRDGQPQARTLTLQDLGDTARQPIKLTIANGPGQLLDTGAIKPKPGAQQTRISILLARSTARSTGLALLQHLQAWATATYLQRVQQGRWQPQDHQPDQTTPEEQASAPSPATPAQVDGDDTARAIVAALDNLNPTTGDITPAPVPTKADYYTLANKALRAGLLADTITAVANISRGDWGQAIETLLSLVPAGALEP